MTAFIASGDFSIPLSRAEDDEPSEPVTPRQRHFALLDALLDPSIGFSLSSLFEHHSPGIKDSLLVWAALHHLAVDVVEQPNYRIHRVRLIGNGLVDVMENIK